MQALDQQLANADGRAANLGSVVVGEQITRRAFARQLLDGPLGQHAARRNPAAERRCAHVVDQ